MVDQDVYCIDVSNQLSATIAVLKKVNQMIIVAHFVSCVRNAINGRDLDDKLKEIDLVLSKMGRQYKHDSFSNQWLCTMSFYSFFLINGKQSSNRFALAKRKKSVYGNVTSI